MTEKIIRLPGQFYLVNKNGSIDSNGGLEKTKNIINSKNMELGWPRWQ